MAGINFIGSYSGVDRAQIDALMQAEKLPLVQLSNKKSSITDKQNAWKDINTRLNSLFDKLKTLQSSETFTSKLAKSTNDSIVTMTTSKNAVEGNYKINVQQLATSTSIISGKVSMNTEGEIGIDGEFKIGENTFEVKSTDTLKDIINSINNKTKDTGISATIINERLVLTDQKTGDRSIKLENGDGNIDILSKLGFGTIVDSDTFSGQNEINNDAKQIKGTNALFTINGVGVERSSNAISDVVEGITINLNKTHSTTSEYDTVTISQDTEKLTKAIQDFVEQYNSTMTFIEEKLAAGDPEVEGSRGALAADSSLQRFQSSLRSMVTSTVSNGSKDIKDISQLGVTTIDKFGKLQFDASKLTESLTKDPQNVMNFFTSKNADDKEIGFATRLKEYVDTFISKSDGVIKGKNESFDRSSKDLNKQIDRFNDRMVRKEAYYIKMFSALDVAMMKAENQMSWLEGQISAMNAQKK